MSTSFPKIAAKRREVRDPIYGFIDRSKEEEQVIDTPVFQRLRGIKQLAMANLVYPGALHTRFDHSLGVMHVAGRLAKSLFDDDAIQSKIRMAALLHDIGHGPFSHVSEYILDIFKDRLPKAPTEKIHELITCEIIQKEPALSTILPEALREEIVELIRGEGGEKIERGIISGPLDADKQDYLLRDSYFCGVKYGVYDLERLISILTVHNDGNTYDLAATEDGVYSIEQFVLAKYHMNLQVYRHKVRLLTDAMIIRALELGITEDGCQELIKLYSYDGTEEFRRNYLEWDDARLISFVLYQLDERKYVKQLFRKLKERKLLKRIYSKNIKTFSDPLQKDYIEENRSKEKFRKIIEREVAEYLSKKEPKKIDHNLVILSTHKLKSVADQTSDEGPILIIKGSGTRETVETFEEVSSLFKSIKDKENEIFVEVFAPVTFKDEYEKRTKKATYEEEIHSIISKVAADSLKKQCEVSTDA